MHLAAVELQGMTANLVLDYYSRKVASGRRLNSGYSGRWRGTVTIDLAPGFETDKESLVRYFCLISQLWSNARLRFFRSAGCRYRSHSITVAPSIGAAIGRPK
jgi:hypothetical protein